MSIYQKIHNLNNSKVFAGILMILMNLGSKYIALELSETQEEFLSNIVIRRIVIFCSCFYSNQRYYYFSGINWCFYIISKWFI